MHKVVSGIKKYTKLPILHIAEMIAIELKKVGIRKIGLLGTKYTMQQDFYKQILIDNGIEVVIPNSKDIEIVNSVIFNELCFGKIKKESKDKYLRIIENLSKDSVGRSGRRYNWHCRTNRSGWRPTRNRSRTGCFAAEWRAARRLCG